MKICAYCGQENSAQTTHCLGCGLTEFMDPSMAVAVDEDPAPSYEIVPLSPEDADDEWVTVCHCRSLAAADMVVNLLEGTGIPATIPDENAVRSVLWSLPPYGRVRVQIPTAQHAAAVAFLRPEED